MIAYFVPNTRQKILNLPFLHMVFFAVLDAFRRSVLSYVGMYYPARLRAWGMVVTHKLFRHLRFSQNMKHKTLR